MKLEALKEAVKTMRKLESFGDNDYPFDFEWPKDNDLLQMPPNAEIKIKDLKYNKNGGYFGAF